MQLKKKKGFTLTEILVVVLVVAVLAAVAYPLYVKSINNARAVEAVGLLEIVKNKQLEKYARDRSYYASFKPMGALTSNSARELESAAMLKINDYTLALNPDKMCVSATYEKRGTKFTFSTSYEEPGLGCEGDVCQAFGNVIGTAGDVCNCEGKTCPGAQNPVTCECLNCEPGTSKPCGLGGSQTCSASGDWGPCEGTGVCTPGQEEACGKCGKRKCGSNYQWGSCGGEGVCMPGANVQDGCSFGASKTCSSSCTWGACEGGGVCMPGQVEDCGLCGKKTCGNDNQWGACSNQGVCTPGEEKAEGCNFGGRKTCSAACQWASCEGEGECTPGDTQVCGGGNGAKTCDSNYTWGPCACNPGYTWDGATCVKDKTACPASCSGGKVRDESVAYQEDGECCISNDACSAMVCAPGEGMVEFFPHPTNSECYCECDNGTAVTQCCPDGLLYDEYTQMCNWPWCVDTPAAEACESSGGDWYNCRCECPSGKKIDYSTNTCECDGTSTKACCPDDSKHYWDGSSCQECANGYTVNSSKTDCIYTGWPGSGGSGGSSGGGGGSSGGGSGCSGTNTGGSGYTFNGDVTCPPETFETGNVTFYPNPSNCSTYIECNCGFPYGLNCPPDLYFCSESNTCTWIWDTWCSFSDCKKY